MPTKKIRRITSKSVNYGLITLAVLGIFITGLAIYFAYSENNQNIAYAGKPAPWYASSIECTLDPSSTDTISPTIQITSPLDGGTVPANDGTNQANIKISVTASDNQLFFTGTSSGKTNAWLLRDGAFRASNWWDGNGLLNGSIINDTPFYFWDGTTYKNAGRKITYQVGMCDFAGNKAYSNTITVTTVK